MSEKILGPCLIPWPSHGDDDDEHLNNWPGHGHDEEDEADVGHQHPHKHDIEEKVVYCHVINDNQQNPPSLIHS